MTNAADETAQAIEEQRDAGRRAKATNEPTGLVAPYDPAEDWKRRHPAAERDGLVVPEDPTGLAAGRQSSTGKVAAEVKETA